MLSGCIFTVSSSRYATIHLRNYDLPYPSGYLRILLALAAFSIAFTYPLTAIILYMTG